MRDLMSHIAPAGANVAAPADNTAVVSGIVDLQDFRSCTFLVLTGTLADADATFTTLLEDGNDSGLSDAAAVADSDMLGTEALASFTFAADQSVFMLGYIGNKRYVRLTVTPAANLAAAPIGVVCVRGHPAFVPTANPPA